MNNTDIKLNLDFFIESLHKSKLDFDVEIMKKACIDTSKYYRGNKAVRQQLSPLQHFEVAWYKSLSNNKPDYAIYDEVLMLADYYACWKVYSHGHTQSLLSQKGMFTHSIKEEMGKFDSVWDLGNGVGLTTLELQEVFPEAVINATNIAPSLQYNVSKYLSTKHNFNIYPEAQKDDGRNFVFASEYFEHHQNPIEHLFFILETLSPEYLYLANSFTAKAMGHFDFYIHNGKLIPSKEISRIFNNALKEKGYVKVKTKNWNQTPALWKYVSTSEFKLF